MYCVRTVLGVYRKNAWTVGKFWPIFLVFTNSLSLSEKKTFNGTEFIEAYTGPSLNLTSSGEGKINFKNLAIDLYKPPLASFLSEDTVRTYVWTYMYVTYMCVYTVNLAAMCVVKIELAPALCRPQQNSCC
jgi:hypothetical protein